MKDERPSDQCERASTHRAYLLEPVPHEHLQCLCCLVIIDGPINGLLIDSLQMFLIHDKAQAR